MSDLLRSWLRDECLIDEPVGAFEDAFANGFLFARVLHRFNQLKDVSEFQLAEHADAKVSNMCLLEPCLRALNLAFTSRQAYAIMQGERDEAAKLLYQIRMAVERLDKTTAPVSLRAQGDVRRLNNMPIRLSRDRFDKVSSAHFASSIRSFVRNQNEVLEGKALKRFKDEARRQAETARLLDQQERAALLQRTDDMRRQRMHQAQRELEFMTEWQDRGLQIWAHNQELARQRRATKKRVTRKLERDRSNVQIREVEEQQSAVVHDIEAFEQRQRATRAAEARSRAATASSGDQQMQPETVSPKALGETAEELASRLERTVADEAEMAEEAGRMLAFINDRKDQNARNAVERERRRRKFLARQMQQHEDVNARRHTQRLAGSLLRPSHVEVALNRDQEDIQTYKQVFEENRAFRKEQYAARERDDAAQAAVVDRALFKHTVVDFGERVEQQLEHVGRAGEARAAAEHEGTREFCGQVLQRVVDLALAVAHFRVYADDYGTLGDPLAPWAWDELRRVYAELDVDVHAPMCMQTPGLEQGVEQAAAVDALLNEREWTDFVSDAGAVVPDGEAPEVAVGEALVRPEYALGEVVLAARLAARPLPQPAPKPEAPAFKLRLAVLGKPCSGKSTLVRGLAERFRLAVVCPEELLAQAIAAAEEAPEEPSLVLSVAGGGSSVLQQPSSMHAGDESSIAPAGASESLSATSADVAPDTAQTSTSATHTSSLGADSSAASTEPSTEAEESSSVEQPTLPEEPTMDLAELDLPDNPIWQLAAPSGPGVVETFDPEAGLSAEQVVARLGREALRALHAGEQVADEVYVRLVVAAIKSFDTMAYSGWVLDGFPETVEQARLLEKLLAGYDEAAVVPSASDYASDIAPPVPTRPRDPLADAKSCVDLVLALDSDDGELARRCLGPLFRRFHGDEFHAHAEPPPDDFAHKRALEPLDAAEKSTHTFAARVAGYVHRVGETLQWQSRFGNVRCVNAVGLRADELTQALEALVSALERQQLVAAEERAAAEAARAQAEAEAAAAKAAAQAALEEVLAAAQAAAEAAEAAIEADDAPADAPEAAEAAREALREAEAALAAHHEEHAAAAGDAAPERPLAQRLAAPIAAQWNASESLYRRAAHAHFSRVREVRLQAIQHYHGAREHYKRFLRRPDRKQARVAAFQASFNSLEQDLRFDDATKEELHLRVSECAEDLTQQTRVREAEAQAEFESIQADGWLEDQVVALEHCFVRAMQAEVDRYGAAALLLREYYGATAAGELRPVAGLTEASVSDNDAAGNNSDDEDAPEPIPEVDHTLPPMHRIHSLLMEPGEEKEDVEQDEELARTQRRQALLAELPPGKPGEPEPEEPPEDPHPLLVTALINAVEAVAEHAAEVAAADAGGDAAAAAAAAPAPAMAGRGKPGSRGRGAPTPQPDDDSDAEEAAPPKPRHLTVAVQQLERVTRSRLERLDAAAREACAQLQALAARVYAKLGAQFRARMDDEFACVHALELLARQAIERAEPLASELRLEGLEPQALIVQDRLVRTFPAPEPPPTPVEERVDPVRFSDEQLAAVQAAMGDGVLTRDEFLAVWQRLLADDVAVPERWTALGDDALERLFARFGSEEEERVDPQEVMGAIEGAGAESVLGGL